MSDNQPHAQTPTPPTATGAVTDGGKDRSHMQILAIFYFVMGGLNLLGVLMALIYIFFGVMFLVVGDTMFASGSNPPPPEFTVIMGSIFILVGISTILFSGLIGGLQFYAGASLLKPRRHILCLVVAGLTCIAVPLGTILGIFTFVVLSRPGVKAMFERSLNDEPG